MRAIFVAVVFCLGLLNPPAFADDAPASFYGDLTQVQLTEDQVGNYIGAMADMHAAMGDAPADAAEPDAKTMAKLDAVAKKHGFQGFNDYNTVAGNIALVLDGVDPDSKTYVGAEKMLQKSVAQVQSDKQMSAKDKKAALADLQAQLKAVVPVKYKSNIDLVVKNFDKLSAE